MLSTQSTDIFTIFEILEILQSRFSNCAFLRFYVAVARRRDRSSSKMEVRLLFNLAVENYGEGLFSPL